MLTPTFTLPALPRPCRWVNPPVEWRADPPDALAITAGARTDWFRDPAGADATSNAPSPSLYRPMTPSS